MAVRQAAAPAGERGAQLGNPVVICVKERYRILGRQALDALSGLDRPITTRPAPSRAACAARSATSWSAGFTSKGGSPGVSNVQPSSRGGC